MRKLCSLPLIHAFDDYHDFYNEVLDRIGVKYEEIGFDGREYIGLFWLGKKPSKKKVKELLIEVGYHLDDPDLELNI